MALRSGFVVVGSLPTSDGTSATAQAGCLIVLDRFHPKSWWNSVREARATIVHYLGVMPPMLMGAEAGGEDKTHAVRFGFGAGVFFIGYCLC